MKIRFLAISVLMVTTLVVIAATASKNIAVTNEKTTHTPTKFVKAAQRVDPPGTINGFNDPAMIPDRNAYLVLFRLRLNS